MNRLGNNIRLQTGTTFIETLVALVVLAIGLLGVLSMHSTGLTSNQRALFASEVNLLVADMSDRIFAYSFEGATAGEYDGLSTTGSTVLNDAVAEADRTQWAAIVNNSSLPNARGDVSWDATAETYTISIRWDDARLGITAGTVAEDCGNFVPDPDADAATNAAAQQAALARAVDVRDGAGISLSCFQFRVNL